MSGPCAKHPGFVIPCDRCAHELRQSQDVIRQLVRQREERERNQIPRPGVRRGIGR